MNKTWDFYVTVNVFLHFCDWWSDGTYGEMAMNGITSVGTWSMITLDWSM